MNHYSIGINGGWDVRQRATRRLYIVNGSDLVTGKKQQAFLPCPDDVLSGQPVARKIVDGVDRFVKAAVTDPAIYFANADAVDHDVKACGKLPAIFAGDDYEIQTPFFDQTQVYNPGDKLYLDGNGNVTNYASEETVPEGATIVGIVSKGVIDLGSSAAVTKVWDGQGTASADGTITIASDSVAAPATGTIAYGEQITGGPAVWTNDTGSKYVLQFYTKNISA